MESIQKTKYSTTNKIRNMEELAKVMIKCRILDDRTKKFNIVGFDFEELLYNELMDLKNCFCAEFLYLIEYRLYYEQIKPNPKMLEIIHEALDYIVNILKETAEERKHCKYNKVIEIIKKYEKDFYQDSLQDLTESQKNMQIRNDIINNTGELLFNLQCYNLTHVNEKTKVEDFWKIILILVKILDKRGKQQEIKEDDEINYRIQLKVLKYLQENKIKEKKYGKKM